MGTVNTIGVVDDTERTRLTSPRDDVLVETPGRVDGDRTVFGLGEGAFRDYERVVTTRDLGHGRHEVSQNIRYRLALPFWHFLIQPLVRRELRRPGVRPQQPWWAPPQRLDRRSAEVLGYLCTLSVVAGYLGTVISQTIAFAADDFGNGTRGQGVVLALVRLGVPLALVVMAVADRRGRRRAILVVGITSCAFTVLGAAAPALWGVGATQVVARGMSTALGLLIGVMAAEESPAGSRAYVVSVLAMFAGLGSGMVVWFLPLADLDTSAWRLLYLIAGLGIPVVWLAASRMPESKRFAALPEGGAEAPAPATHRSRLRLLATSAFLFAMFAAPASQFLNDFLKEERGFSASRISLFQITTNTLVGVGVLVGGRLADRRGRRVVGAAALLGGVAFVVLRYSLTGWTMWAAGIVASIVGAATIPALGVYGAELFGTARRGRSKAKISIVAVVGSALGLLVVGLGADQIGYSSTFAMLALGPVLVAILVVTRYPETARRELEDINPEDVVGRAGAELPPRHR